MCVKDNLGSNITHEIQLKMLRNEMEVVKQSTLQMPPALRRTDGPHTHTQTHTYRTNFSNLVHPH